MKNMYKDILILFVITLIAGLVLGGVNELTKDRIAEAEAANREKAYMAVFSDASSFQEMDINVEESDYELLAENGYDSFVINSINKAMDASGNELGIVMDVTTGKGYGGDIEFTVGLRNDGTLNGVSLLEINETAGLGMNAEKELVPQFKDKKADVFTVTKTGSISESEIDAISGATITSNAITNGVNACLYYHNYIYGGEENE